jgi:hypothetical protein
MTQKEGSALIQVSRTGFKFAWAAVAFRIVVDGEVQTNVWLGQTAEVQVRQGDHTVRVTRGRYGVREWGANLEAGQVARFRRRPTGWAFQRHLERDLYLTLEPSDDD